MTFRSLLIVPLFALGLSSTAHAEGWYLSGYGGINMQSDSSNSGETGSFTTGNLGDGSTLAVASGTDYGWNTEFDSGTVFGIEGGKVLDSGLRFGLEASISSADVDTHTDVTLGGGAIGSLDAAAIAGSPTALGVTIAQVVAAGEGDIETTSLFANAYYHFDTGEDFSPYIGVGIGLTDASVEYMPSGISVIDGSSTVLAYQGRAGAAFNVSDDVAVFAEYTYRASEDIELDNVLFPGTLEIENQQSLITAGVRFGFE